MLQEKTDHIHDKGQSEKSVPSVIVAMTFGHDLSQWASGVNTSHLDQWVKVDRVKQRIKRQSMSAGYVLHGRVSAFDDHLDHCFIVL